MATITLIVVGANTAVQLSGNDPFSYVDAVMAGFTAAATTKKSLMPSVGLMLAELHWAAQLKKKILLIQ